MADSDSLPLQGPPLPAPPVRGYAEPPSVPQPGYVHSPPATSLVPSQQVSGGTSAADAQASTGPDKGNVWLSIPVGVTSPGSLPVGPPPAPPVVPMPRGANGSVAPVRAASPSPPRVGANPRASMQQVTVAEVHISQGANSRTAAPSGAADPAGTRTNPTAAQAPLVPTARPAAGVIPPETGRRKDDKTSDDSFEDLAYRAAPPWLVSALVHMLMLIILGLIFAAPRMNLGRDSFEIDPIYSDRLGDQLLDPTIDSGTTAPDHADKMMITPTDLNSVEDPFAAPKQPEISLDGSSAAAALMAPTIGLALSGRQEGSRQSLLGRYGGNTITEGGVQGGLAFLARQQRPDGSWSLKGPYSGGAYNENVEAATAMALLAFQGHGNTHNSGQYKKNVANGIKYLLSVQAPDGNFYQGNRQDWLYTHAQCTIAVCELYGMTKDSHLRLVAEKAVQFCVEAQDSLGGWRYRPRMDSDTSVTGWMVMALQSARMAGLDVPKETLDRVGTYLDKVTTDGVLYGYQVGQHPDPVMTAEALLCRQYLGWTQYDPKLVAGVEYLGSHLPTWLERDVYYWYYGTQVMHHFGGDHWKRWNDALAHMLVENQEKNGPEKGSWDPKGKSPDAWAVRDQGGRLYVTCLSLYMLEIYYRHMPLYPQGVQ